MRIEIPVSVGELVDRITILRIKAARISAPGQVANVRSELALLEGIFADNVGPIADNARLFEGLAGVNSQLWDIEDQLRVHERDEAFGDEFIERARQVYRLNDERYRLKREIGDRFDSEVIEEKSYSVLDPQDLFDPAAIADPYTYFAQLREREPVHWNERFGLWVVTGYDEVVWILRHPERFSSAIIKNAAAPPYPPVNPEDAPLFDEVRDFRSDQLVEQDRPEHLEQRKTIHAWFTPTAMEAWRPFVRDAVGELLDELGPRGRMNVVTDLAAPLPVRVIARMLDVPYGDMDRLRELADSILHLNRGEPDRLRPLVEGIRGILEYSEPFVESRIGTPGDDLISALAQGEKDGVFTRHQVLVNTGLLLFAGHETTMNLICNGLLAFIRHPDEWDRLRADPGGLCRLAAEECLRYDPPVKSTQRIVSEETTIDGRTLREGQRIRWIIAAANRDPSVFPDPDRFDISRQPNPHLSFGSGIHYCLGVALARMEGQEVFRALAERFERFDLASGELEYQPSIQFRSLKSLEVTW